MFDEERDLNEEQGEGEFVANKEIDIIDDDGGIDMGNELDIDGESELWSSFSSERAIDE